MDYKAVYEYIATVFTDAFTEMCQLQRDDPTASILPNTLQLMATDKDAFLNFIIVVRVMLLKVLLLLVQLGKINNM